MSDEICPCCGNSLQVRKDVQFTLESKTLVSSEFAIVFSNKEAAIFDILWRGRNSGRIAAKQVIWNRLYDNDPDGGPDPKILDIWIMRIRRKLAHTSLEIVTSWSQGWFLRSRDAATSPGVRLMASKPKGVEGVLL